MFASIRAKLIGLSIVTLLCILLVGGSGYYGHYTLTGANTQRQVNSDAINAHLRAEVELEVVRADVLQVLHAAKNGDPVAYEEAQKKLNEHLNTLEKNIKAGDFSAFTEKIRQAAAVVRADEEVYAKLARDIAALAMTNSGSAEMQFNAFNELLKTMRTNRQALNKLFTEDMDSLHKSADSASLLVLYAESGALLAALVLVSLFATYIYKSIANPLSQLQKSIAKVDAGAYEVRVNMRTKDELGMIGRAFDKLLDDRIASLSDAANEKERLNNSVIGLFTAMGALSEKDLTVRAPVTEDIIGTLGDAINQLTDVTATVLHHVTNVASVVEHASERMKQQSDVVNDMAKEEDVIVVRLISNLETAMASIGEVAIYARDSSRAAAEATKSTESAMETVQATLGGMSAIRETISEMEKRIKRLGERSQEISQIVNLINTISERTHVLSLNAAMQAAMAGEAGRGFAVVAEEVQRLAENSRQATGQIANLVQNIQVETNDTIATVNKTIDQVVKESELAHNAGERMRETHESTARLVRLVATIASSSAEQTKIATSLRAAADEITQFTAKTAEQLDAQNQSAASLVTSSKKLMESVSVFKLPPVAS